MEQDYGLCGRKTVKKALEVELQQKLVVETIDKNSDEMMVEIDEHVSHDDHTREQSSTNIASGSAPYSMPKNTNKQPYQHKYIQTYISASHMHIQTHNINTFIICYKNKKLLP